MKWNSKKKVLIISDDLEGYDLECHRISIPDTKKALALLDLTKATQLPHLIIVEMAAPGIGGFEFARQFQERFGHLKIPLIIASKMVYPDDISEAMSAGADGMVKKPVTAEKVIKLLEERRERLLNQNRVTQTFRVTFNEN